MTYRVGDVVQQRITSTCERLVYVTAKLGAIKHGLPGFQGFVVDRCECDQFALQRPETGVWGYDTEVVAVVRKRPKDETLMDLPLAACERCLAPSPRAWEHVVSGRGGAQGDYSVNVCVPCAEAFRHRLREARAATFTAWWTCGTANAPAGGHVEPPGAPPGAHEGPGPQGGSCGAPTSPGEAPGRAPA